MWLSDVAVKRPVVAIVLSLLLCVFGAVSFSKLAVREMPDVESPVVTVMTRYEGAAAAIMESQVTAVIEDNITGISGIDEIQSVTRNGMSRITVTFDLGWDLTEGVSDIRDAVAKAQRRLPDQADEPIVAKNNGSGEPSLYINLNSTTMDRTQLTDYAERVLSDRFSLITGVSSVNLSGGLYQVMYVKLFPELMAGRAVTTSDIVNALKVENVENPGGEVRNDTTVMAVRTARLYSQPRDFDYLVVRTASDGTPIYLKDVAQVYIGAENENSSFKSDGINNLSLGIVPQSDANPLDVASAVRLEVERMQDFLPEGTSLTVDYDSTVFIERSISEVYSTLFVTAGLVVLVLYIFIGQARATLIPAITVPVSLISAFIAAYSLGFSINLITLMALILAIGLVVDDAIVVLENITTHIERGSSPKEAAIYATNEVWLSVIATTLVVVAVFLPLTMVPGMAGILFRELGWIVSIVVTVSTMAALTLTPMMSAYLLKLDGAVHEYKGIGIIYKPIDKGLTWLDNSYASLLAWAVNHRRMVVVIIMSMFFASLLLLRTVPTEFFPPADNGRISGMIKLEQNLSVEYTSKIAREIDSTIYANFPEVNIISASAGANSSDNAFAAMQTTGSHIINYNIRLPRASERDRSIYEISDILRAKLDEIPEVREYTLTPGGSGGPVGGAGTVDIKVFGYEIDVTTAIAEDLREKMKQIPGLKDVQLSREDLRPEYNVTFDRDRLSYYGLNSATASQFVRNRIDGLVASKYREDGDEYDIVVRYGEEFRTKIEDVENIVLYGSAGQPVRLKEVAKVVEEFAAPSIERENRERVIRVQGSLGAGVALGTVVTELNKLIKVYDTPEGVSLEIGGTIEEQGDAFSDLMMLFVLIVILVYIVMATQFESLMFPFIIMFTIPFAFTGVFLALWATSTPLSIIALIGAIMLVGIVTKNGIVMVDYMNLLVERGSTIFDAIIVGGKSRLRPVLMTSLTTILGMLPMAIGAGEGAETWQPMGIAVIGGLTFSTLLTLFIIPVLYSILVNRKQRKEREKKA